MKRTKNEKLIQKNGFPIIFILKYFVRKINMSAFRIAEKIVKAINSFFMFIYVNPPLSLPNQINIIRQNYSIKWLQIQHIEAKSTENFNTTEGLFLFLNLSLNYLIRQISRSADRFLLQLSPSWIQFLLLGESSSRIFFCIIG